MPFSLGAATPHHSGHKVTSFVSILVPILSLSLAGCLALLAASQRVLFCSAGTQRFDTSVMCFAVSAVKPLYFAEVKRFLPR